MAEIVGLRFRKGQAKVIEAVVERLHSEGIATEHITLFEQAAQAAKTGQPLKVVYEERREVEMMAAGFTQFGLARPSIEDFRAAA